jgi:hypothetical protein
MEKSELATKIERSVFCIFEFYRYLNFYIKKMLPNEKNAEKGKLRAEIVADE